MSEDVMEIYDSLARKAEYYQKHADIDRVKKYMVHYGKAKACWKIRLMESEQQKDGTSCGIFTIMNAKAIAYETAVPPSISASIVGFRMKIATELLCGRILPMRV